MAKNFNSEEVSDAPPSVAPNMEESQQGAKLVTVLYSQGRDLYRIPSIERVCWLSVKVYPLPATMLARDEVYLGPSVTGDGLGWRKSYAIDWRAILGGDCVTLPADDPMVRDYEAFQGPGRAPSSWVAQ
jgi:hypothetical protein